MNISKFIAKWNPGGFPCGSQFVEDLYKLLEQERTEALADATEIIGKILNMRHEKTEHESESI